MVIFMIKVVKDRERYMRFLLIVWLLLLPEVTTAEPKTLVFLGDSLTAGYGLPEEQAFPALVQEFLRKDGFDWRVVNAGISGDTTQGGLKRLKWVLRANPGLVFVALGGNDGLRGLKLENTQANLEEIILRLKEENVRVVLAGVLLPTNYGEPYREQFKSLYPILAKKHEIPLLPFLLEGVAGISELNQADGIHPNEAGQKKVAEQVYTFLKPILEVIN
jgi:acyl-CoA thioesterase-1